MLQRILLCTAAMLSSPDHFDPPPFRDRTAGKAQAKAQSPPRSLVRPRFLQLLLAPRLQFPHSHRWKLPRVAATFLGRSNPDRDIRSHRATLQAQAMHRRDTTLAGAVCFLSVAVIDGWNTARVYLAAREIGWRVRMTSTMSRQRCCSLSLMKCPNSMLQPVGRYHSEASPGGPGKR